MKIIFLLHLWTFKTPILANLNVQRCKRNYNKNKPYCHKVVPFPFIMFGEKSIIEKCDRELVSQNEYFTPLDI